MRRQARRRREDLLEEIPGREKVEFITPKRGGGHLRLMIEVT